jgi:hypothetical protein
MLEAWAAGRFEPGIADAEGDSEVWQRAIWTRLWQPGGLVERWSRESGETWLTAPKAFEKLPPASRGGSSQRDPRLRISYAARAFHEIFGAPRPRRGPAHLLDDAVRRIPGRPSPPSEQSRTLLSRDAVRRRPISSEEDDPFGLAGGR